jgi:hypothetical protein
VLADDAITDGALATPPRAAACSDAGVLTVALARHLIGRRSEAGLAAGFGRDAAHAEWFYGVRLAIRTGLGFRLARAWGIGPAAGGEREVADDLSGRRPAAGRAAAGPQVHRPRLRRRPGRPRHPGRVPPSRGERRRVSLRLRRPVAALRNRIETSLGEVTGHLELARHGAHTFWGLPTGPPPPRPPTPCCNPTSYDQTHISCLRACLVWWPVSARMTACDRSVVVAAGAR